MNLDSTNKGNHDVLVKLTAVRVAVIPPYCEDDDESDRDPAEYVAYFRRCGQESLAAARRYEEAIVRFASATEDEVARGALLEARSEFIGLLPFVRDDLPDDERATTFMLKTYASLPALSGVLGALRSYQTLLCEFLRHYTS